jgi:hypothetical protein
VRARFTTSLLLLLLAAGLALLPACRARSRPPSAPDLASGVVLIASVIDLPDGKVDSPGDPIRNGLRSAVQARDLETREFPHEAILKRFPALPDSEHRLTQLATFARDATFLLLLETRAQFHSHASGRYRWMVHSRATGDRIDTEAAPMVTAIDIPVTLTEPGDRPRDAVSAAAPAIAGQVASLLDNLLVPP